MSHGAQYQIGQLLDVRVDFIDLDGQPANPATIDFYIRDPSGNVETLDESDATNPAVGEWHWLMPTPFDQPGTWRFRAAGTLGLITAVERTASVAPSLFG